MGPLIFVFSNIYTKIILFGTKIFTLREKIFKIFLYLQYGNTSRHQEFFQSHSTVYVQLKMFNLFLIDPYHTDIMYKPKLQTSQ